MLAVTACALGIAAVSDTSLRKHFSKASYFLHEILHSMLSSFLPGPDISAYGKIKNVLLVDASVIRQDGKKQEQQRIYTCYSLNKNRICEIKVTNQHTAGSLKHFSIGKDGLVMADAGYGTANNYIYTQEQKADVILRITPKNFCLYDADDNKIPLVQLLKKAEKNHKKILDIYGFCKYMTKKAFVRVIAGKLPDGQAEKSRKRKKNTALRKQNHITEETLFCAGWIVVVTSLGAGYCSEGILYLYRNRWQVELLFKRFKQNFSITTLKAGSTKYAETEVLLWLIIWVISERQSFLAECFLKEKNEIADYSVYEKSKLAFLQIREILCLSWSQFIDITNKKYLRYLSKRKRHRINKNDEFHTAILSGLLACLSSRLWDADPDLGKFLNFEEQPKDPATLQGVLRDEKHSREHLKSGDIKEHIEILSDKGREKKPSLRAQLAQDKKTVNAAPKKQAAKSKNKRLEV